MFQQGRQFLRGFHSSGNSGRNIFMVIGTRVKIEPEILHCIGEERAYVSLQLVINKERVKRDTICRIQTQMITLIVVEIEAPAGSFSLY